MHKCASCDDECTCYPGEIDAKRCTSPCEDVIAGIDPNDDADAPCTVPDEFDEDETCDFTEEDVIT